jgi:soluble lytic murein transglycosylase-like protein
MYLKLATKALGPTAAALFGLMIATADAKPVRPTEEGKSCRSHVTAAEQRHRIPRGLLHAVAMTESTYNPLALNIEGRSVGVPDVDQALKRIRLAQDQGIQNISIGCLQILVKYHVHRVGSTRNLIEPATNAAYGARYLRELYNQTGDWWRAVARYHTSDPEKQAIYLCRVYANYAQLRNIAIDERAYRDRCARKDAA